jgi:hypothetical protein
MKYYIKKLVSTPIGVIADKFIQSPVGTYLVRTKPVKKLLSYGAKSVRDP